jgi:GTP cyclohydrolase II
MVADFDGQLARGQSSRPVAPAPTGPVNRLRDFGLGAQVLADLGCGKIRLMTNNPRVVVGASGYGLDIVECVPMRAAAKVLPLREQG